MLLVGYLYGIKSERRLIQDVQLNLAIDASAVYVKDTRSLNLSKTRQRKWNQSNLFYEVFVKIIRLYIDNKLVNGEDSGYHVMMRKRKI